MAELRSRQSGNAAHSTNRTTVMKRAAKRARRGSERARALLMEQDLPALGIKPLDEWTLEELARGKPKREDGTFRRGIPNWLTPEIDAEINRRYRKMAGEHMNVGAIEGLIMARKLIRKASSENVRLDASKFFIEQVFGKAKQQVDVTAALKVEQLLGVALVNPDGSASYGTDPTLVTEGTIISVSTGEDEDEEE